MDHRNELDHWASVWDKACKKDLFPSKAEDIVPSANQADQSFFGVHSRADDAPSVPSAPDAAYWNKVYKMSNNSGDAPDVIQESVKAISLKQSPNPIKPATVGADQDLTAAGLDATFSEKDIEDLSVLKVKLHELQDKLNEFEGRGENSKKFETQITKLKAQIDGLSDSLTRSFYLKEQK